MKLVEIKTDAAARDEDAVACVDRLNGLIDRKDIAVRSIACVMVASDGSVYTDMGGMGDRFTLLGGLSYLQSRVEKRIEEDG